MEARGQGKTGHSSQIFRQDLGYGANYELARILDGFRRKLAGEAPHLQPEPGARAARRDMDEVLSRGSASGKTNVIARRRGASAICGRCRRSSCSTRATR
jgi:glutamate carboxypeptidase